MTDVRLKEVHYFILTIMSYTRVKYYSMLYPYTYKVEPTNVIYR